MSESSVPAFEASGPDADGQALLTVAADEALASLQYAWNGGG